jgi:hypothetical protein
MTANLFAATLFLAATTALTAQSNVSFELHHDPNIPQGAGYPVVQGDFNKDGKPDLITIRGNILLQLGNGDGTFQAPVVIGTDPSNLGYNELATADLNRDGNLDLIATTQENAIRIFYGNGDGTFQQPITVTINAQFAKSTAIGDFNGDGLLDLAVGDSYGGIEIFNNQGGKNFVYQSTIPLDPTHNTISKVRAGDINANGITALAALTSNQAYVLWGDGKSHFTPVSIHTYALPADLNIADLNQDGNADIMVTYHCGAAADPISRNPYLPCTGVDVFYGQGNQKTFYRPAVTDPQLFPSTPLAVDVNGDGIGDLVIGSIDGSSQIGLFVYLGHPDGSFDQTPQRYISSTDGGGGQIAVGDFNRDGMMDFADGSGERYLNATHRAPCATSQINPTVTVCQPVDGAYTNSPLRIQANAFDTTPVTALQEYIDFKLVYNQPVTSFDIMETEALGPHLLVTKAFDARGVSLRSNRNITVYNGTPGATCAAALGSASICLPATATAANPVHILANGYTSVVPTAAQLYIDGSLVINDRGYCYTNGNCVGGNSAIDTYQTLSTGSHALFFKLYDANGNAYTAAKTITVQ